MCGAGVDIETWMASGVDIENWVSSGDSTSALTWKGSLVILPNKVQIPHIQKPFHPGPHSNQESF